MKTKFTCLIAFTALCMTAFSQQIPNSGFETWTSPLAPDGWATWETATGQPLGLATKDTADKREGTASIKIKTDSVQAGPQKLLIAGIASLGTAVYAPPAINFYGVPFTSRPDTLFFSYKYAPAQTDTGYLELEISGTAGSLFAGAVALTTTAGQWINIYVPLTAEIAAGTVDSIRILFASSISGGFQGSELHVDAIRLGYVSTPTAIHNVQVLGDISVFPNPASDRINIRLDNGIENGLLEIMDVSGRVVLAEGISGVAQSVNITRLSSGVYFYRLKDSEGSILKQERFNVAK